MKKILVLLLVIVLAVPALVGCGTDVSWSFDDESAITMGQNGLTEKELRVIALEYKGLFEFYYKELYGEGFWEAVLPDGRTYEEYIKTEYILEEARAILFLTGVASEQGLSLTEPEIEQIEAAAKTYYAELTADAKAFIDADWRLVAEVLKRYALAVRAVGVLTEGKKIEISDEEARVMDVVVIRVTDEEKTNELKSKIAEGENFMALAREYSEDARYEYSFSRNAVKDRIAEVLFSLKEGEISDVIFFGDSWYVFRNVNSYNVLLSEQEKTNLLAVRRYAGWKDAFNAYAASHEERLRYAFWESLKLSTPGDFPYRRSLFSCLPESIRKP